ncbi:U2 snRNP complex subunit msl1 [Allomyces arbusculus]|nr:U2 snRNP complex subunit msl1 [Allomyces arbusculus]
MAAPADAAAAAQTLYVKNLCTKVQKQELRQALYYYFSSYGAVVDVVALKTPKMRGQAFIVFRDASDAAAALRDANGKLMFDKPMTIDHARTKSHAIRKLEGTFVLETPSTNSAPGPELAPRPPGAAPANAPIAPTGPAAKRPHDTDGASDDNTSGDEDARGSKRPRH